jgi:hypothetical protein
VLAVSISVPDTGRLIEAAVSDTVPVAELIPHLVDAAPGDLWRLTGPTGVVRPEHSLSEAGVRPGERLTLARDTVPAPPVDEVGDLSGPVAESPAVPVVALATAAALAVVAVVTAVTAGGLRWSPVDLPDAAARDALSAAAPVTVAATVAGLVCAVCSLHDRRFTPLAATLGLAAGLPVSVLTGCVAAALLVWRRGACRTVTVTLAVAAAVNLWPGLTVLAAVAALTWSGQLAVALARVPVPRIPATGLFARPVDRPADEITAGADRARRRHTALVPALCTVVAAGVVQLIPAGTVPGSLPLLTVGAVTAAAVAVGLSGRGCRPVHATATALTAVGALIWLALHLPGFWPVTAVLPVLLPLVRISSPTVGRVLDWAESAGFALAVPLLAGTTGVYGLLRGIGL